MKNKERFLTYVEIAKRAEKMAIYNGERINLLIDIENADKVFNLRLKDWLEADDFNFAHDLIGIVNNIDRSSIEYNYHSFGLFVPRYADK